MEMGKNKDGMISLNYPMLTRANYTAWAMKMKVYMQAHGVWDAISPKNPKSMTGIPEDVLLSLANKETAKEAWEAIRTLCQGAEKVKTTRTQTLKAEFESMTMKDSESVDDFSTKLNNLVTNIRALGEEAHEERIKGQTETGGGKLLLTSEEWIEREREDERKLLLTRDEWMRLSNKVNVDASQKNRSKECNRGARDKSKVHCFNCSAYGHYAVECKKPRRDKEIKEEANMIQIPDDEPALLMVESTKEKNGSLMINKEQVMPRLNHKGTKEIESNMWYLENGASNHMIGQFSKFREIDTKVTGQVKFGNGSMVQIKGKGSIILKCKNGESRVMNEVYYIPTLRSNIIRLGQLSENGYRIIIKGENLWVHED
ncbi:uncharacterized protein LOC141704701 [Apium graveolens]|uniref:uncharacterized protein LOC141704701 n=1 Tax=Apium graveolens TaxID=4045 RepID=UPI003D79EBBA